MEQDRTQNVLLYFQKLAGQSLIDIETVVSLISGTTTQKGLKIDCIVDNNIYETGRKISDEELAKVTLFPYEQLGKWNYKIKLNCKD